MLDSLRRLAPYLHRYRYQYAIGTACVVAAVALRLWIPRLLGGSIDVLREASETADPTRVEELQGLVVHAALLIVGAALVGAVIRSMSRLTILGNSRLAVRDVRRDLFAHLLELGPPFYVRHSTGQIMSRCVNDMQNVQGLLGPVFLYLVETALLFAVGVTFMLGADVYLTLVGLAPFPFFLLAARRMANRVQEGSRQSQEKLGDVSAKVDESLSGHRVIKSLALEDTDLAQFRERCEDYSTTVLAVARVRATLLALMAFLATLSTVMVLTVGASRVQSGEVTIGGLIEIILYLGLLAVPTRTLGFVLSSLQRGAAALGRIGEILDTDPTIVDTEKPVRGAVTSGALEVRDLSILYPASEAAGDPAPEGAGRQALAGVTFSVPAGQTLGIVGATGSGKTTLLRTLARQLEVEPGRVFVDGVDLVDIPLDELRAAVGMAPQDAFLFSETLLDNVRLGAADASREAVMEAVAIAGLDADLDQLPDGIDTMLGERGVNLSGGQRQRASLARVALLRPAVLLLDDTLSAVDTHTADAILAQLRPLMAGRTTVIVAHRLSTVRDADHILVLRDGRITERGNHEELIAQGGEYAALWQRQSTRERLAEELELEPDLGELS